LGFSYFASCVLVSHGYVHVEQVGVPVTFAGLTVQPGDLLHADKHGVLLIPAGIAPRVAEACERARRAELPVVEGCRSMQPGEVTVERLREWRNRMISLRKGEA
jgi:regulator of RNase E activity RraA